MASHEIYCNELQLKVTTYSKTDLEELIKKSLNVKNHADYVTIYQNELRTR